MEEPIRTSDGAEVKELLYIQDGRTLYKVSTVYPNYITAIVCLDSGQFPARTTVRELPRTLVAQLPTATDRIVDSYHARLDA
jgi:hypothetical protein